MWRALVVVAGLAVATSGDARAGEPDRHDVSFSGFGTLAVSRANEDRADFTSSLLKYSGAGGSRRWSGDVDSRLGGQVTWHATPQLTAVVQMIAEQRFDNSYTPIVEWANLKYQVTPDFSIRAGRIALPTFLAADYRKVSFALPWVRTPVETYGVVPITNSDGIDATYRWHGNGIKNTIQAAFGRTKVKIKGGGIVRIDDLHGLSDYIEVGHASMRLTWLQADIDIDRTRPLFDAFRAFGAPGEDIARRYDATHKKAEFLAAGVSYDPGAWFVTAEYGRIDTHSFLGRQHSWYAGAGIRHGSLTPYLLRSHIASRSNLHDPGLPVAALPPPWQPAARELNAGLASLLHSQVVQDSTTIGLRWDVLPTAALKIQYDRLRPRPPTAGSLINVRPGYQPGRPVSVLTLAFDFVF